MREKKTYIYTFICSIILHILLFSCASTGPVSSPDFERIVRNSLQLENEKILFANSAEWMPGTYGFENPRQFRYDQALRGVLVCTEQSLYFLVWDNADSTYIPRMKMDYKDISSAKRKKYGLGLRFIVQNEKYETHSFQALSPGGISTDSQKTEMAYQIIQNHLKK
jgi:hypothetical protein